MKRIALILTALVAFTATEGLAAPGDAVDIVTNNLTGGENVEGWTIYFGPASNIVPGLLQVGQFDWGPITGNYYYFPTLRSTQFLGTYVGSTKATKKKATKKKAPKKKAAKKKTTKKKAAKKKATKKKSATSLTNNNGSAVVAGTIRNDSPGWDGNLFGTLTLTGFGEVDGVHIITNSSGPAD